jgi:mannose-1-phosphate guanylyltransferase
MVLAAGRGERMRPLSDALPKPALPLPNGPVVWWAVKLAAAAGIPSIVVNSWHLAPAMESAVLRLEVPGVDVRLSRETCLMGTAGGLALARDRGYLDDDGPVLVLNGDGVLNLEIPRLIDHHNAGGHMVTLGLLPHLDPSRWSRVLLDSKGRVREIRPPGVPDSGEVPLLYPGVMVVSRAALDLLEVTPSAIGDRLWGPVRAKGRLGGTLVPGHWREVGTPGDYLETALAQLSEAAVIHPTAKIAGTASIDRSMVGRAAVIGSGSAVMESVVAEGAVVGHGARVNRSVILGPVEVGEGETVEGEYRAARVAE